MTELLTMMATPVWAYLALFGFLTVDALLPVVPTQAIMITTGALTVYGNLSLPLVITVGALGVLTGDTIAFALGRSTGQVGRGWLGELRRRCAPQSDDEAAQEPSRTRRAAGRITRGLRRPGPLVLLLCRFVPGGRMAAGFHAGRTGYPVKLFLLYDSAAALGWAAYGGLVGHVGGTAVTESAWRLFAVAATAAVVFGTAGWILALFGGSDERHDHLTAAEQIGTAAPAGTAHAERAGTAHAERAGTAHAERAGTAHAERARVARTKWARAAGGERAREIAAERTRAIGTADVTATRAASADAPPRRSTRTTTGR